MIRNRISGVILSAVLIVLAAVLGATAMGQPQLVFPLTVELLILAGITMLFLQLERDRHTRRWLARLVLAALGIRLVLLVVIHFGFTPYAFAPDAGMYEYFGEALRDYWMGEGPRPGRPYNSWQTGYYFLNGIFFSLFGTSPMGPVVLNLVVSVWTCLLAFLLGRTLFGESVGKLAALLVAFFPSLVLWSVLNIRDALSAFLVTGVVFIGVRMLKRIGGREVLGMAVALLLLTQLRDYLALLLLAGLLLGFLTGMRPNRVGRTLILGAVSCFLLLLAARSFDLLQSAPMEGSLETLQYLREDMARGAGSAYGHQLDTSTVRGLLTAVPMGMAFFLFGPFPWAVSSTLQLAALPEVLLWYALIPFTLVGLARALRVRHRDALLPIAVLVVITVSYALVEGNIGTAYRHRAQIMPLVFLFTSLGLERWLARRRRSRAEGRRGAGSSPGSSAERPISHELGRGRVR
jgi:4-amino-4-deoxy-L-arabinose transferase-like glycosyltransferase